MTKKNSNTQRSPLATLLGAIVVIVVFVVYLITGVDLTGGGLGGGNQPRPTIVPQGNAQTLVLENGFGASLGFWEVYFTEPGAMTNDRNTWRNGIDTALVQEIDNVRSTLDIAAFEFNNTAITEAVINAHDRGVRVRIVTDNEHGIDDDDSTLLELEIMGVPIVPDTRSAFMHNKFMIMDGITVWTGSWNYTMNGTYRNNNNALAIRSRRAVEAYQREFEGMFNEGLFGPNKRAGLGATFTQDNRPMRILFSPKDDVIGAMIDEVSRAQKSIHFMIFSYTRSDLSAAMVERIEAGIPVQGVIETTGSETEFSEMRTIICAGGNVRQDGNNGILHHKVIIIDEQVVITGSFNFSNNAVTSNDENLLIIQDPDLALEYLREFGRVQSVSRDAGVNC